MEFKYLPPILSHVKATGSFSHSCKTAEFGARLGSLLLAALHYIFNPYSYLQLVRLLGNRSQVDSSYSFFLLVNDGLINNNKSGA